MTPLLVPLAWDLLTALTNGKHLAEAIGGSILGLFGIVGVIMAIVFVFLKLLSEQFRMSWIKIIGLFILGGLCLTGGIALFVSIASGSQTTINSLGNGVFFGF